MGRCADAICDPTRPDCSGHIASISFGLVFAFAIIMMFVLLSGPPTFENDQLLSPGDTLVRKVTYNPNWCRCVQLDVPSVAGGQNVTLMQLDASLKLPISPVPLSYQLTQRVDNIYKTTEWWEVVMHPGSSVTIHWDFNQGADIYFARGYDTDGLDRDPDFQQRHYVYINNSHSGSLTTPPINASDTYAFVFLKNFEFQANFSGIVHYSMNLTEIEVPRVDPQDVITNHGRFCWGTDGYDNTQWLLAAEEGNVTNTKMVAQLTCVPRYVVTVPVICVPAVLLIIIEIIIVYKCVCKANKRQQYEIIN